ADFHSAPAQDKASDSLKIAHFERPGVSPAHVRSGSPADLASLLDLGQLISRKADIGALAAKVGSGPEAEMTTAIRSPRPRAQAMSGEWPARWPSRSSGSQPTRTVLGAQ